MFRRASKDGCQVCGRPFASSGARVGHELPKFAENVYTKVGERHFVNRLCERCWQRHERYAAETHRRFVRGNPPDPLLAILNDVRDTDDARIDAMHTLVRLGDPRTVPALIALLHDRSEKVRHKAIASLGQLKDPSAGQPLCRRLRELMAEDRVDFFGEPGEVLDALADIGDPSAAEPMSEVLLDRRAYRSTRFAVDMDVNFSIETAVDALDTLGGLDLVLDAYARALRSADPDVRGCAARDLSSIAWSASDDDRMSVAQETRLRELLHAITQDQSSREQSSGRRGLDYLDNR
jgi:hypothetical protein